MPAPAAPKNVVSRIPVALLAAFFLSGGVALIYQSLWTRRLGLVFGVTIQAASTVLASFMAGLAIGSYIAGRRSDQLTNPLRVFAWVELLIGACALLTLPALAGVESVFLALAPYLADNAALKTIVRIALSALVLIVPAALMGATYPLVLRAVTMAHAGMRKSASLLYGINTAGAIVGVLTGSLWMVPTLGIQRSFLVAAGLNVLVGLLAFWLSRGSMAPPAGAAITTTPAIAESGGSAMSVPLTPAARTAVLIVIALSGAVSLAFEIIWFRVLVFFLRPTTYAFASMLATVLLGIAVGSLVATPLLKRRANWLAVLAVVEVLIGLTGIVSAFMMVRSYDVMEWMWTWTWLPAPYDFVLPLIASAAIAIVPTSILLGAAFPLGLLIWTEPVTSADASQVGRRVGVLYALNVTGAIAGSILAGFLLIPSVGSQVSLILIATVPIIGGAVLLWMSGAARRTPILVGSAAAFAVAVFALPDVFHDVIVRRYTNHEVLWHQEDAQTAVSVVSRDGIRTLLIDGMHHASDGEGMVRNHEVIGAMALAVHPDPRQILIVGLGGGATAGSVGLTRSALTQVVELSPSVIAAGRWFDRTNHSVLKNPRVGFQVDDGRNFLLTTERRFDLITADPILPEMAGAANLYSADYFAIARRALAPGGMMLQWLPTDNEYRYKMMLRSFASAFPHMTVWHSGGIVFGSATPIRVSPEAFARISAQAQVGQLFEGIGLRRFDDLLGMYVGGRDQVMAYVGEGPMLRDDRPVIEYFLSMPGRGVPVDPSKLSGPVADLLRPTP